VWQLYENAFYNKRFCPKPYKARQKYTQVDPYRWELTFLILERVAKQLLIQN